MEYDRITLGRLAKEQGFVRDTLEKVCRLTDILLFIPVLRRGERFDAGMAETTVRNFLRQLLKLTDDEKQFLLLFSQKQYKPELLFDDAAVLARIAHHPMAIWKCEERGTQQPVR